MTDPTQATRRWGFLGALLAGAGVLLGAFAAHGLKSKIDANALAVFDTGVRYQMIHAAGMILLAAFSTAGGAVWRNRAGWAFLIGTALFSGSLYTITFSKMAGIFESLHVIVFLTPIGGVAFVIGWGMFAVSFCRRDDSTAAR